MVYTGLGVGAGAALCYPDQLQQGKDLLYEEGSRNLSYCYNLATGGERGRGVGWPRGVQCLCS